MTTSGFRQQSGLLAYSVSRFDGLADLLVRLRMADLVSECLVLLEIDVKVLFEVL